MLGYAGMNGVRHCFGSVVAEIGNLVPHHSAYAAFFAVLAIAARALDSSLPVRFRGSHTNLQDRTGRSECQPFIPRSPMCRQVADKRGLSLPADGR